MLLTQIEAFIEVARWGNMRRAGIEVHVSQPALTARIQALESELRVTLFRRTRDGMELTSAGAAFLPHAERALLALREGEIVASEVERGLVGELVIGAAPAICTYVLPEILSRFARQRPRLGLSVRTGHSEEIVDLVLRGDVQLGLTREIHDDRVAAQPLYEDQLVLVARPDHPLAGNGEVDLAALANGRFILFDRTSSYYELTSALLRDVGFARSSIMELDNIAAAKRMVERGLGVSLLPAVAVSDALRSGRLCSIPWTRSQLVRRRIVLIARRDGTAVSSAAHELRELLLRIPKLIPGAQPVT